jgi:hypothetical protein
VQVGAALPAEFEIIVNLKTAPRTEHGNSSFRMIVGADVTSSRLINATKRYTIKLGLSEPFSGQGFPKNGQIGAIFRCGHRRQQWLFNKLALRTRWHANWMSTDEKI